MKDTLKRLTPDEIELSLQSFSLAIQEDSGAEVEHRFVDVNFDEIAKCHFPNAQPRFLDVYQASSAGIQAFLNEGFLGLSVGRYQVSVIDQAGKDKNLKKLKVMDDLLVLVFFATRYRLTDTLERARLYQMLIEHGIEQQITTPSVNYVSSLLLIDPRTLEKDIKNAGLN